MIAALGLTGEELTIPLNRRFRRPWRNLAHAYSLWRAGGVPRWRLEGRLLAGQTNAEIGAAEGLPDDVVDDFHAAFFCNRDKLHAKGYINSLLFGVSDFRGVDVGKLWSFFAFHAGVVVLQALIDDFQRAGRTSYSNLEGMLDWDSCDSMPTSWLERSIAVTLLPSTLTEKQMWMLLRLSVAYGMFQRPAMKVIAPPVLAVDSLVPGGALCAAG
jgi:hypothetical protein